MRKEEALEKANYEFDKWTGKEAYGYLRDAQTGIIYSASKGKIGERIAKLYKDAGSKEGMIKVADHLLEGGNSFESIIRIYHTAGLSSEDIASKFNKYKIDKLKIGEETKITGKSIDCLVERYEKDSFGLWNYFLGVGAVAGFVFSLFFLSSNVTGNVIGNAGASSNNVAGIITLTASFLLAFLALRK